MLVLRPAGDEKSPGRCGAGLVLDGCASAGAAHPGGPGPVAIELPAAHGTTIAAAIRGADAASTMRDGHEAGRTAQTTEIVIVEPQGNCVPALADCESTRSIGVAISG